MYVIFRLISMQLLSLSHLTFLPKFPYVCMFKKVNERTSMCSDCRFVCNFWDHCAETVLNLIQKIAMVNRIIQSEIIEAIILIVRWMNCFIWFERLHVACGLFAKLFLLSALWAMKQREKKQQLAPTNWIGFSPLCFRWNCCETSKNTRFF